MNKISMRLQTPADKNGNRTDIHVITSTDEVLVDAGSGNSRSLTEKLTESDNTISNMSKTLDNNTKDIGNIDTSIDSINEDIQNLSNNIGNVKTTADNAAKGVNDLSLSLQQTKETITQHDQSITNLTNSVKATNDNVDKNAQEIENIKSDNSNKLIISSTQPKYACIWGKPI